jgi:hypothetical protein
MTNYSVDREKWAKMTIFEQMGNIYSEVGRSFNALGRGDLENQNNALYRAIDLFDATAEVLISSKPSRVREVLRAKDQYLEVFFGGADANSVKNIASLDRYFMQYALAARINS